MSLIANAHIFLTAAFVFFTTLTAGYKLITPLTQLVSKYHSEPTLRGVLFIILWGIFFASGALILGGIAKPEGNETLSLDRFAYMNTGYHFMLYFWFCYYAESSLHRNKKKDSLPAT